jgi:hypothetical protein
MIAITPPLRLGAVMYKFKIVIVMPTLHREAASTRQSLAAKHTVLDG